AAEYVLGTLHGAARQRFERLLRQSPDLQYRVGEWEERLSPMAEGVEPVAPPKAVWKELQRKTAPQQEQTEYVQYADSAGAKTGLWYNLTFWRSFGMVAASVMIVFSFLLGRFTTQPGGLDYVYVVQGERSQPEWVVSASFKTRNLTMKSVNPPDMPPGQVCELWALPEGGTPHSLGILPHSGIKRVTIDSKLESVIRRANIAVSIEPTGGSTQKKPTGKIISRGPWLPLI
ncbi:MAG: hypothetical protein GY731_13535, partial [Gammaproteobacteria bacterium]|nr:hypothetical protein [Gammaproteobacteria bacterium]